MTGCAEQSATEQAAAAQTGTAQAGTEQAGAGQADTQQATAGQAPPEQAAQANWTGKADRSSQNIIITYVVPCYNAARYMDHCIESILAANAYDLEIIIVDDGSDKDATAKKADAWAAREPARIRVIHQENKGHGGAIMTALETARGRFFKVVDADDWLDNEAHLQFLDRLRLPGTHALDLIITNYVIENEWEHTQRRISYERMMRRTENRLGGWSDVRPLFPWNNITMHAMTYRTELLRDCHLDLPEKTFYVDCLYAYIPLPAVKGIMYINIDLYRYFVGRIDQSTNVQTIVRRIDEHIRVTEIMMSAHDFASISSRRLRKIMMNYLTVLMGACTAYSLLSTDPEADLKRLGVWIKIRETNPVAYRKIRRRYLWCGSNYPGTVGNKLFLVGFQVFRKIFKFT